MSLMNDALRKKNRETTQSPPAAGFSDVARRPRPTRKWVALLTAVILITGASLAGIHLMQSKAANPPMVTSPLPDRPIPLTARSTSESSLTKRPEDTTIGQLPAGESPAAPFTGQGAPPAVSSTIPANAPPPRPRATETMANPEDAKMTATVVSHGSRTTDAPVAPLPEGPASVSRSFEPGPDHTVRSAPLPSVPRQAKKPVDHAPSSPETTAAPKADQTVLQSVESKKDTNLFYRKARSYHRSGRLTDAIRLYRQVLKSSPNHPGAMLNLSAAAVQQGNFADAQALLQQLEQSNPRPPGVLLNLAITAIGMDAPEQALTYLDRATLMSDASPWEIRFHRAVAFSRMNRLPEALALYQAAESERPDAPGLQFNLAVTCDALGLYPEALAHYEAVLKADSDSSETDKAIITQRVRMIGRYLDTAQPPAKG